MFPPEQLEHLRKLLNNVNIDDGEISRGVADRLTPAGIKKVADEFHIETHAVIDMLHAVKKYVSEDLALTEDEERYSYEGDWTGSITLRDAQTGQSKFLQGDDATVLSNQLAAHPDMEQALIAQYFDGADDQLNEDAFPIDDVAPMMPKTDHDHSTPKSTMNFPYKDMIATAQFWLDSRGNLHFHTFNLMASGTEEDHKITPELQVTLDKIAEKFAQKMRMGA